MIHSSVFIPYAPLIPYEIHSWSKYPHYHMLDSKTLPLSSMVLHTQQAQSDAYRLDNHPVANKGKAVDNDVFLVGSALLLLAS